jgi:hypothetical protein
LDRIQLAKGVAGPGNGRLRRGPADQPVKHVHRRDDPLERSVFVPHENPMNRAFPHEKNRLREGGFGIDACESRGHVIGHPGVIDVRGIFAGGLRVFASRGHMSRKVAQAEYAHRATLHIQDRRAADAPAAEVLRGLSDVR